MDADRQKKGFPLKELLILVYLAAGCLGVAARIASFGASPEMLFYFGLYGLLAISLLLTAYVENNALRCIYALLLFASAVFGQSVEQITDEPLTYDSFINLFNSIGFAGDALDQHMRPMAWAVLGALPLLAGIALKPRRAPALQRRLFSAAPVAGVLVLSAILFVRGGEGATGLPSAFPPLAYSTILLYESETAVSGPVRQVAIPRRGAVRRDIVLVIDESVSGNYLDLNNPAGVRTGLAGPHPGIDILNYGYAASITNCSVGTNVTLRHGGTRAGYQAINATMPSIWDYARKAGLRTVYIDAQRTRGQLQNLMTEEERRGLDAFVQFDRVPVRDRDMAALSTLAGLLANRSAEFIIINKMGAHFPVQDKYPDSFMRYRPVLARGGYADVGDTGSRAGFGGSPDDWLRYRNSYRNALLWNVGAFFDRLFAHADLSNATLVYTSDHGQDLHERGNPGLDTHCSANPVAEEGLVPLVVIQGSALRTLDWRRNLESNRNRVSHYQIFPTLLALMGYDPAKVRAIYGDSLVERSRDALTFNTRFNARLGLKPVWKRIDPRRIVAPPPDRELRAAVGGPQPRLSE